MKRSIRFVALVLCGALLLMQPLQVFATEDAVIENELSYDAPNSDVFVSEKYLSGSARNNAYIPPADDPKAAIDALRTTYPEGMEFSDETHEYYSNGREYFNDGRYRVHGGSGCHAFALMLSDAAYGSMPIVEHSDFDDLRIGDAIRVDNDTHTLIVTDINGDEITVAQANYGGKVHWDEKISRSDTGNWVYVITRRKLDINSISEKHYFIHKTPVISMGALRENEDFTVEYTNREDPGSCVATVKGINNFYGTRVLDFSNPTTKIPQNIGVSHIAAIDVGQTEKLVVNGPKTPVTFSSSDDAVATVDNSGVVTGRSAGTVEITVSAAEDRIYQAATTSVFITIHGENSEEDAVRSFVERMYEVVLEREPDAGGLDGWTDDLKSGKSSAVDIVRGFLLSPEYTDKEKTNEEIIKDCYSAMLDRSPDEGGFNDWILRLESGMSVEALFAGFVCGEEFGNLCGKYGINPGKYTVTEERDKNAGVTMFVSRLYDQALGRSYDLDGLNYWCKELNNNSSKSNVLRVATEGFFHSDEFLNKKLSNEEFVKVCYRTYLGREYDRQGFDDWVKQLENGKSRDEVMAGFAYSDEFSNIMAGYGL